MAILFGPVLSKRLGISLGLDIIKSGHCSYDCIYCEAGKTKVKTIEPAGTATPEEVIEALDYYFEHNKGKIDYITFSGTGEPTLNPYIGEIIKKIKKRYKTPVCLLTNSSLLWDHNLVKAISKCDLIMPSLDAVSDDVFIKINRPCPGIHLEFILIGLKKLIKISKGKVIIEILIVEGINDSKGELLKLSATIKDLNPYGVFLNTVYRVPASDVKGVSAERLKEIGNTYFKGYLNKLDEKKIDGNNLPDYNPNDIKFKKMLEIRGADLNDLQKMFKKNKNETLQIINELTNNDIRYYTTKYTGQLRLHYDPQKHK